MRISLYYLIIPAFILGSCASKTNSSASVPGDSTSADNTNLSEMQDTVTTSPADPSSNISLTVSPGTFKEGKVGKATLTVTNNGTEEITFGDPYKVEYNNGGNWDKVTIFDSIAFTAMAHGVAPGKSQEFAIQLQPIPYNYKPGEYRILKDAQAGDKQLQLTATFSVGK
jgi:hypothetical protein